MRGLESTHYGPDKSSDDEIWADCLPGEVAQELRKRLDEQMITITRGEYESMKRQIAELSKVKSE